MSITCRFNGRLGNILFNSAQVIAYAHQYGFRYAFPSDAWACMDNKVPLLLPVTGQLPLQPFVYNEPVDHEGCPYYHQIPVRDDVQFNGYYQSFRYFENYREQILSAINLPWEPELGIVGIHVRRGDCITQPDAFPMAPMEYYHAAIELMLDKGYNQFRVYSDDIPWCKEEFTTDNYPEAYFTFSEGYTDVEDFITYSSCNHQITARSTFSLMAGWFNQYGAKHVLCPSVTQQQWWKGQNKDLLTGTEHWLTQVNW